jgi:hypothetical protein
MNGRTESEKKQEANGDQAKTFDPLEQFKAPDETP